MQYPLGTMYSWLRNWSDILESILFWNVLRNLHTHADPITLEIMYSWSRNWRKILHIKLFIQIKITYGEFWSNLNDYCSLNKQANQLINWNSLVIDIHSSLHTGAWQILWCWQNNETQQKINVVQSKLIEVNPEQRRNSKGEVDCDKFVIDGILLKSYYFLLFDLLTQWMRLPPAWLSKNL